MLLVSLSKRIKIKNPALKLFPMLEDRHKMLKLSIMKGLVFSLTYSCIKLFLAAYYHSWWFLVFAIYYILLSLIRFLLLKSHIRAEKSLLDEYKVALFCGIMIFAISFIMSFIIMFMTKKDNARIYPDFIIYIMAMYSFYAVISAVVKVVKNSKSPEEMAYVFVLLVTALVSMLSLEGAMLIKYGDDERMRVFMIALTGLFVFLLVAAISIYMIFKSAKAISELRRIQTSK